MIEGDGLDGAPPRRPAKSEAAFRTISEVSEDLSVPQHVLRFWESKFTQIKPLKRGGGRRYYRPEDILLLKRIRDLLYNDGYTIRGVQKLLREQSRGGGSEAVRAPDDSPALLDDFMEPSQPVRPVLPEALALPLEETLEIASDPFDDEDNTVLFERDSVEVIEVARSPTPTSGSSELGLLLKELEELQALLHKARRPE